MFGWCTTATARLWGIDVYSAVKSQIYNYIIFTEEQNEFIIEIMRYLISSDMGSLLSCFAAKTVNFSSRNNTQVYNIRSYITLVLHHVQYMIWCTTCDWNYKGCTTRMLKTWILEHNSTGSHILKIILSGSVKHFPWLIQVHFSHFCSFEFDYIILSNVGLIIVYCSLYHCRSILPLIICISFTDRMFSDCFEVMCIKLLLTQCIMACIS